MRWQSVRLDGDPDIPPTAPAPPPPPPPCPPPPPRALPALAPPPPGSASSSHCKFIESFSRHNCQSSETSSQRSARTNLEEPTLRRLRVGARPGIGGGEGGEHRPGRHSRERARATYQNLRPLLEPSFATVLSTAVNLQPHLSAGPGPSFPSPSPSSSLKACARRAAGAGRAACA